VLIANAEIDMRELLAARRAAPPVRPARSKRSAAVA
jgi:hypothetical protein